ncbi:substrate-binding domain-containing protein [Microbulbifer sp. SSSA002]|uniref:substrate-binding domain-containing protein n=1 Tax=unclassified Microbulbifer TaxID=2619833 RepID=UPI0040393243
MRIFLSRTKQTVLFLLGITLSAATSATQTSFPPGTSGLLFTLHGSNTVGAKLAPNLISNYLRSRGASNLETIALDRENEVRVRADVNGEKVYIDIAAHGSSTGFKGLEQAQADIAMASRPIRAAENAALNRLGDLRRHGAEHVIAIDGLAIIVHPHNPVNQLTLQQIAAIFAGEITDWSAVGGRKAPIKVLARDDQSGTWDTFQSLVLGNTRALSTDAARFESSEQLSDRVSAQPNSIGFVGLASIRQSKALAVADNNTQPQSPGHLTIATEDYPLSRRLFLYSSAYRAKPAAAEFLQFVQSEQGQEQVKATGFVAQTPIGVKPAANREGPEEYLKLTENAQRLSINFRFSEGSASLDNKAQQDIQRLVRFMQKAENKQKRLLLIGFGDEKVSASRSIILSKLRATTVRSALRDQQINTVPVQGFGAYLPVASNGSSSKIKNRRVEIWII